MLLALPTLWSAPLTAEAVADAMALLYRRARRARRRVRGNPDDDDAWHALRKRCKALAVVLAQWPASGPRSMATQRALAARIGRLLGKDHDLAVLQRRCGPLAKQLAPERARLQRQALRAADVLLESPTRRWRRRLQVAAGD
jgi:hypothetical protein